MTVYQVRSNVDYNLYHVEYTQCMLEKQNVYVIIQKCWIHIAISYITYVVVFITDSNLNVQFVTDCNMNISIIVEKSPLTSPLLEVPQITSHDKHPVSGYGPCIATWEDVPEDLQDSSQTEDKR